MAACWRAAIMMVIQAMSDHDITGIDLVVVNLYPFAETVASGADYDTCIENIDIGGPAMIRASAKNHAFVTIITQPSDYKMLIDQLDEAGGTDEAFRRAMAYKAFSHTATYDAAVHSWLAPHAGEDEAFASNFSINGKKTDSLRYGENPHQKASGLCDWQGCAKCASCNAITRQGAIL